jgi:hypothetical protein
VNASWWCAAASGEKQQNTTRLMPDAPVISAAAVPTAMRAAARGKPVDAGRDRGKRDRGEAMPAASESAVR